MRSVDVPVDLPDVSDVPCCMASAVWGPDRCTCWTRRHDHDQATPIIGLAVAARDSMCSGCAFKPRSPERTGDNRYQFSDEDDRLDLIAGNQPFYCHEGMRRVTAFDHPCGVTVPVDGDHYDPPTVDGIPFKSDGTPADVCAGWTTAHDRFLRQSP